MLQGGFLDGMVHESLIDEIAFEQSLHEGTLRSRVLSCNHCFPCPGLFVIVIS